MDCLESISLAKLNLLSRLNPAAYCKLKDKDKRYKLKEKKEHFKLIKKYVDDAIKCKGKKKFLYTYSEKTPIGLGGRLYSPTSIQGLDAIVRGYLFEETTTDIDMKNCHPKILSYICKINGYDCPNVDYYINNRDEIMGRFGDRDTIKRKILAMVNSSKKIRPDDDFLSRLDKECKDLQKIITARDEFEDFKKPSVEARPENILGSHINRILCYYENKILQVIINTINSKGIGITAYMFDGLLINGNHYDNDELLRDCENAIEASFPNLTMKLDYKEHSTTLNDDLLNDIEVEDKFPDLCERDMAELVIKQEPNCINCLGSLYIFDKDSGMYRTDTASHHRVIYDSCIETCGKLQLTMNRMDNVRRQILLMTVNDNWLDDIQDSSIGYMLYKNGYYDFKLSKFNENFNSKIMFMYRIPFDFEYVEDQPYMESIKNRLFYEPLGNEVGEWYIQQLARAFAGDRMKILIFCIGTGDTGKSTITKAIHNAIGQYAGTFNAECFAVKNGSGDDAQALRWALLQRYSRIILSNELDTKKELNGNMIKKCASGGDQIVGRLHNGNETSFCPHFLAICMMNDLTPITPYDQAIKNRVRVINYSKVYVDDPDETQLKKDPHFDKEVATDKFKQSLNKILTLAYQDYIEYGEKPTPYEVIQAEQDWVGVNVNKCEDFALEFNITSDIKDFCSNESVNKWIVDNKIGISTCKFCIDMKAYIQKNKYDNVYAGRKKINGRTYRGWFGIKEVNDVGVVVNFDDGEEEEDPTM